MFCLTCIIFLHAKDIQSFFILYQDVLVTLLPLVKVLDPFYFYSAVINLNNPIESCRLNFGARPNYRS